MLLHKRLAALALLSIALAAHSLCANALRELHQAPDASTNGTVMNATDGTITVDTVGAPPTAPPAPTEGAAGVNTSDLYKAGCYNFTMDKWQPHRPGYHITVPYGWMNDPVGMFQAPNGRSHVFFQYNPLAVQWGAPYWGHVASDDLAHWTWLPPALLPDKPYDFNGCWSGGATVTTEGVPILTYTAAGTDIPELGNKFQRQASALPANMSDPWLKEWVKPDTNPFLAQLPPGGINTQFRDPTEARHGVWLALTSSNNPFKLADGSYALAIGGQAYCLGNAAMYVAPNMTGPWRYVGNLYNQLAIEPEINGQCMAGGPAAPANYTGPSYGGPCDQFGAACRAWEVVDFLELEPGLFALKWNDQSRYRRDFALEWYTLGNGPFNYRALAPPSDTDPAGLYAPAGNNMSNNSTLAAVSDALANMNDAMMQMVDALAAGSGTQEVLGQQYSSYGNATMNQMNMTVPYGMETAYNFVNASDESATEVLFQAQLNGKKFYPQIMDYGSIYASMVFRTNDSRQVMYTWTYETAAGCANQCSDEKTALTNITGFKSVLNLPRQLTYDRETETMRVYPINETELLRGAQVYAGSDVVLPESPRTAVLINETAIQDTTNTTARQMEIQLWFNITMNPASGTPMTPAGNTTANGMAGNSTTASAGAKPFKVGTRVYTGNNTYVDVYLNGTAENVNNTNNNAAGAAADGASAMRVATLFVWVDRSNAGGYTNTTFMEGGPVPTPVSGGWLLSDTKLKLSVFVDHTMWEVYAQAGLGRITSRVYPSDDTVDWGVGVFGDAGAGGQVAMDGAIWQMENAWLPPNCD